MIEPEKTRDGFSTGQLRDLSWSSTFSDVAITNCDQGTLAYENLAASGGDRICTTFQSQQLKSSRLEQILSTVFYAV
jgi:hypothetical protein